MINRVKLNIKNVNKVALWLKFRNLRSTTVLNIIYKCWYLGRVDDLASTQDLTTSLKHNTGLDILHNLMFICWFKNILLHIFIFYSQVAWSIKTSWLELLVAWFRWSSYCLVATLLRYVKICRHNVNGQEYNPDFDMSSCSYPFPKFILHKFLTVLVHMLIIVIFTRIIIKNLSDDLIKCTLYLYNDSLSVITELNTHSQKDKVSCK